jgi:hypothetical protein
MKRWSNEDESTQDVAVTGTCQSIRNATVTRKVASAGFTLIELLVVIIAQQAGAHTALRLMFLP